MNINYTAYISQKSIKKILINNFCKSNSNLCKIRKVFSSNTKHIGLNWKKKEREREGKNNREFWETLKLIYILANLAIDKFVKLSIDGLFPTSFFHFDVNNQVNYFHLIYN